MTNQEDLTRRLMAQPMGYPWPDPTNERIQRLEAENGQLRDELTKTREVTDEKVERVLHAVKPYVSDRLDDMEAEDMAWNATRAALGGGDDE